MLQSLHIQNYAIIQQIQIDFSDKLNIITGETGAGKSILMGALSLILGNRADSAVLIDATKKCVIEGVFNTRNNEPINIFLADNDLDTATELTLRREIAPTGKSRAFINDTPVTLQQLKQLATLLVDLHKQFDTIELGSSDFQRDVVDALANNKTNLNKYQQLFKQWNIEKKQLDTLLQQKANFRKELDYNQFLFDELSELSLKENELEDLDAELKILNSSEDIKNVLQKIYYDIKESEQPILTSLKQHINQLQNFASISPSLLSIVQRMQSMQIELQDIAAEVEVVNSSVVYDEQRLNTINDKLMQGYKLLKKHQVKTTADLLTIQNNLQDKLQNVLQIDDLISKKEILLQTLHSSLHAHAQVLLNNRQQQVKPFEQQVNKLLHQVGMPNAQIKVTIDKTDLNEFGFDSIDFLFDANKSNKFEPIKKVASGGELSRLMLCIKSLIAQKVNLPTLIFDEIDTGISGEAAKQVGIIMQQLASSMQIICITHQPQIAAKAHKHLFVYKAAVNNKINTSIKYLSKSERITAIAQMLSGENPTQTALASAEEMMLE